MASQADITPYKYHLYCSRYSSLWCCSWWRYF